MDNLMLRALWASVGQFGSDVEALIAAGIAPIAGAAGTTTSPRATGIDMDDTANLEFDLRVRFIDDMFDNMSDYDVFVQKRIGGDKFETRNVKTEWGEQDLWSRRFLAAEAMDTTETGLDVPTGTAHRYPKGTLLKTVNSSGEMEIMWVSAAASADSLTVVRAASGTGAVPTTTGYNHALSQEYLVIGNTIAEGATRALRGTPVAATKFNYSQISRQAVGVTFRQNDADVYGRSGTDIDTQLANVLKQLMVGLDENILEGRRYAGTGASDPGGFGGLDYFFDTSVDSDANVVDLNSAAITEKTFADLFQTVFYKVGNNMGHTLLVDAWTKRKINAFWQPGVRQTRSENVIGTVVDKIATDFGEFEVFMHQGVPKGKTFLVNPEYVELGHYGSRGRWNTRPLPVTNDTIEEEVYGDYTLKVKNAVAQGKIQEISQSA
jgi:hypothetical protein